LQKQISLTLKKIYPLSSFEIKTLKVDKEIEPKKDSPKEDKKEKKISKEEEKVEEKKETTKKE
jgi:hypothetical protein